MRSIAGSLRRLGIYVSHQTVHNWIEEYVSLTEKYSQKITPQVSDIWRSDEPYPRLEGP